MSDCLPSHSQLVEELAPVSAKWDQLGIFLGFTQNDLDEIRRDKQDTIPSLYAMCNKWLERNPSGSWKDIVTALQKIKILDLADELKKKYMKEEVTSARGNFMPPSEVHTGSVLTCTNNDNFPVSKNVTKEVTHLESKFSALLARMQCNLKQKVDQNRLTLDELGRFVSRQCCIPYQPVDVIVEIDPIDALFGNLKHDLSPFESGLLYSIDSAYLEGTMKNEIDAYDNSIDQFENSTVITDFKNALERHHESHPRMPLVLKLGKNWGNRTLKNLHHLIDYMFKGNATLLRLISIHYSVLTIKYAVPRLLLLPLITMASRKVVGLSLAGVLSIQVGTLLLNISKHDSDLSESILQVSQCSHDSYVDDLKLLVDDLKLLLNIGGDVNSRDENNQTPLIFAAVRGEWLALKVLLQYKADPNISRYQDNVTPLYIVSQNGQHGCVYLLLKYGANPNVKKSSGFTPLIIASQFGHYKCVNVLLQHKANPNIRSREGTTAIYMASQDGHSHCVDLLLQYKANHKLLCETDGSDALGVASNNGHCECIRLLLQHKADPNVQFNTGATALYHACQNGHNQCVDLLLRYNADPNIIRTTDNTTPLFQACQDGNDECASLLLKYNANPNIQHKDGATALLSACQYGHHRCAGLLLHFGAKPNIQANDGHTALHQASRFGYHECVDLLLRNNANPNIQNQYGNTALHEHITGIHHQCVSLLLQHKGDPNVLNTNGISPLMVASGIGHLKCVQLLLQNNAEPNIQSQDGITALMMATVKGHFGIIELLLKSNADPNIFVQGEGALDIACLSGNASIVSLLIDHDAVIERQKGKSLLIAPIQKSDYDTVKILIEAGIDVNVQDEYDGSTPLLLASASGNKAMVQLLLDTQPDILMRDNLGLTAYDVANIMGFEDIATLLALQAAERYSSSSSSSSSGSQETIDAISPPISDPEYDDDQTTTQIMKDNEISQPDQKRDEQSLDQKPESTGIMHFTKEDILKHIGNMVNTITVSYNSILKKVEQVVEHIQHEHQTIYGIS